MPPSRRRNRSSLTNPHLETEPVVLGPAPGDAAAVLVRAEGLDGTPLLITTAEEGDAVAALVAR
jgi:hypothetical protein